MSYSVDDSIISVPYAHPHCLNIVKTADSKSLREAKGQWSNALNWRVLEEETALVLPANEDIENIKRPTPPPTNQYNVCIVGR